MGLPSRIRVGPHTYRVTSSQAAIDAAARKEQADLYGHTDFATQLICVAPDLTDDKRRVTLVHEWLHCLTDCTGILGDLDAKEEERFTNRLAPALLDSLRRSPALVDYLLA